MNSSVVLSPGQREKTREEGAEQYRCEVQSVIHKIIYKNISYNTGNVDSILNNCEWIVAFNNCESLYCAPVACVTLYIYHKWKRRKSEELIYLLLYMDWASLVAQW